MSVIYGFSFSGLSLLAIDFAAYENILGLIRNTGLTFEITKPPKLRLDQCSLESVQDGKTRNQWSKT